MFLLFWQNWQNLYSLLLAHPQRGQFNFSRSWPLKLKLAPYNDTSKHILATQSSSEIPNLQHWKPFLEGTKIIFFSHFWPKTIWFNICWQNIGHQTGFTFWFGTTMVYLLTLFSQKYKNWKNQAKGRIHMINCIFV